MEALRIVKTLHSDRIPELNQYLGRNVEIIVLPETEKKKVKKNGSIMDIQGSLKKKIDGMEFQNRIRKEWDR